MMAKQQRHTYKVPHNFEELRQQTLASGFSIQGAQCTDPNKPKESHELRDWGGDPTSCRVQGENDAW